MKKLDTFAKNTFHYSVLKRHGNIALIKGSTKEGGTVSYEVIHIREREETKLFNNIMPATEYPPGNEEFSTHGWSYPNLGMAEKKFTEIISSDRFQTKKYLLTKNVNGDKI